MHGNWTNKSYDNRVLLQVYTQSYMYNHDTMIFILYRRVSYKQIEEFAFISITFFALTMSWHLDSSCRPPLPILFQVVQPMWWSLGWLSWSQRRNAWGRPYHFPKWTVLKQFQVETGSVLYPRICQPLCAGENPPLARASNIRFVGCHSSRGEECQNPTSHKRARFVHTSSMLVINFTPEFSVYTSRSSWYELIKYRIQCLHPPFQIVLLHKQHLLPKFLPVIYSSF